VVCVEAYNRVRNECLSGKFTIQAKRCVASTEDNFDVLIQETIEQMKTANAKRCNELENDLNVLIEKKIATEWKRAPLDLSEFQTGKIIKHFKENPNRMTTFEVEPFKNIFAGITAIQPGKVKVLLINGSEIYQEYKPMRGQVNNAQKYRNYSCKADK